MSGEVFVSELNDILNICFKGSMSINLKGPCMHALAQLQSEFANCEIDLRGVTFLDSSGLGLLLIIKNHALLQACDFKIITADNQGIHQLLTAHRFNELFKIGD